MACPAVIRLGLLKSGAKKDTSVLANMIGTYRLLANLAKFMHKNNIFVQWCLRIAQPSRSTYAMSLCDVFIYQRYNLYMHRNHVPCIGLTENAMLMHQGCLHVSEPNCGFIGLFPKSICILFCFQMACFLVKSSYLLTPFSIFPFFHSTLLSVASKTIFNLK